MTRYRYRVTITREYYPERATTEEDALIEAFELEHMGHVEVAPVVEVNPLTEAERV